MAELTPKPDKYKAAGIGIMPPTSVQFDDQVAVDALKALDPSGVAITGGTAQNLKVSNSTLREVTVAGPRSLAPDQIPGLQLWLDASQPMFTASFGAVVASAGDFIGIWPDRSGNNRFGTASATKPTYDPVGMNGRPTINFNGNSSFLTPSFLDATYNNGFTLFVVSKPLAGAGNKAIVGAASNGLYLVKNDSTKQAAVSFLNLSPQPDVNPYINSGGGIDGLRYTGSATTYQYDRLFHPPSGLPGSASVSANAIATTGVLGLSGTLTIGDLVGGSFAWPGQISEVVLFNTALTIEQYRAMYDYLAAKWGFYSKKFVLCAGNSLTSGQNSTGGATQVTSTSGTNYPSQMWALLGSSGYDVQTDAYPGRTTAQMLAETPLYGDMLYLPSASASSVCVVWEVTNELAQNQSAANAYDKLVRYCKARRAQGYTVVVATCIVRSGSYAGFEADRQKVNTLIRANWTTFADGLADIAADSRLQNTANTTYFGGDLIHLTDAGYAVVASIVAPAVQAASALAATSAPSRAAVIEYGVVDNTPIGRGGAAEGAFTTVKSSAGVRVSEGTNAKQGTATLVAGTVVVSNTSVTANSRIFLTSNADGGTPGFLRVSARTAGTSFTILSSSGTDTSTVAYEIFEPA